MEESGVESTQPKPKEVPVTKQEKAKPKVDPTIKDILKQLERLTKQVTNLQESQKELQKRVTVVEKEIKRSAKPTKK